MWAEGSPLAGRAARAAARFFSPVWLGLAGLTAAFATADGGPVVGDVVAYEEDRLGRPWHVIDEPDRLGRVLIRNGRVTAVADPEEIGPYERPAAEATRVMAGEEDFRKLAGGRGR